jgi:hypothetical protein
MDKDRGTAAEGDKRTSAVGERQPLPWPFPSRPLPDPSNIFFQFYLLKYLYVPFFELHNLRKNIMCVVFVRYTCYFLHVHKFTLSKLNKTIHELELGTPFDFNSKFQAHPNNRIRIGSQFISILDLGFLVQSNSILNSMHQNTA